MICYIKKQDMTFIRLQVYLDEIQISYIVHCQYTPAVRLYIMIEINLTINYNVAYNHRKKETDYEKTCYCNFTGIPD